MEALSKTLQPHKDLVGLVASVVTIGQFFSGAFVCKDIYKKGTTQGIPATPFIGGVVIGVLMLKQGFLLNDTATLQVNTAAIILNVIYTAFYYNYSTDKRKEVLEPLGIGALLAAVLLGYTQVESPENLEYRYGLIMTILMLALLAAPLKDVVCEKIIEEKNASAIPFPLTIMGTIVSFLWLLYGIILMNDFMIFQNIIGFTLCSVQLALIFLYPETPGQVKRRSLNEIDEGKLI